MCVFAESKDKQEARASSLFSPSGSLVVALRSQLEPSAYSLIFALFRIRTFILQGRKSALTGPPGGLAEHQGYESFVVTSRPSDIRPYIYQPVVGEFLAANVYITSLVCPGFGTPYIASSQRFVQYKVLPSSAAIPCHGNHHFCLTVLSHWGWLSEPEFPQSERSK